MDDLAFIVGLMRKNTDALGFIPITSIKTNYIDKGRYVLQTDRRGRKVGYLLHGTIKAGKPVVITQHVIEYDKRLQGFGWDAFRQFVKRCATFQASLISLKCGSDLPAVQFWQSCGFMTTNIILGGIRRKRIIFEMQLPLTESLPKKGFDELSIQMLDAVNVINLELDQ